MLDWMGFPSVRNMTDDERDANDERVRLAIAAIDLDRPIEMSEIRTIVDPKLAPGEWYLLDTDGKRHYPRSGKVMVSDD